MHHSMRVIALSATLPNLSDIGEWLGCDCDAVHYFDESFRPVPLTVHTVAMGSMNNPYLFERSLDDRVHEVIARYSDRKQVSVVLSLPLLNNLLYTSSPYHCHLHCRCSSSAPARTAPST